MVIKEIYRSPEYIGKKTPRCSEWKTQFRSFDVVCKQCDNYKDCKLDIDGED